MGLESLHCIQGMPILLVLGPFEGGENRLANRGTRTKDSLLVFVDKVLLEYRPTHSFNYSPGLPLC